MSEARKLHFVDLLSPPGSPPHPPGAADRGVHPFPTVKSWIHIAIHANNHRNSHGRKEQCCSMNKEEPASRQACPRCGSSEVVMKSRTNLGDSPGDDVIRTDMMGCAVILKYCACEACGHTLSRAEYESMQQSR